MLLPPHPSIPPNLQLKKKSNRPAHLDSWILLGNASRANNCEFGGASPANATWYNGSGPSWNKKINCNEKRLRSNLLLPAEHGPAAESIAVHCCSIAGRSTGAAAQFDYPGKESDESGLHWRGMGFRRIRPFRPICRSKRNPTIQPTWMMKTSMVHRDPLAVWIHL
jgi:hypothetical protein